MPKYLVPPMLCKVKEMVPVLRLIQLLGRESRAKEKAGA